MLELPEAVTVYEVGPRDGLQNEPDPVGADVKVELIERLAAAGLPAVEATSFVRPEWVPQLADAEQVAAALRHGRGTRYPVLVPNAGGLRRAIDAGVEEIAVFGSATESFARRNLNRSVDESLAMFAPVVADARAAGLRVRGYVSMVWGDPWEGAVPVEQAAGRRAPAVGAGARRAGAGRHDRRRDADRGPARHRGRRGRRPARARSRSTSTTPTARRWRTCSRRSRPA